MSPTQTWFGRVGAGWPSSQFSTITTAGSAGVVREHWGWVLSARCPLARSQLRNAPHQVALGLQLGPQAAGTIPPSVASKRLLSGRLPGRYRRRHRHPPLIAAAIAHL
jgi:hypothetical protein